MNLRDALDVKVGSTPVNKIYKGTYKVWDRNKIALEGYCKQETTEGRNLIEPKIATGTTKNGITITNNGDGSYILNGTATTGTDIRLDQSIPAGTDNLKNYTAGTYSLSCNELKTGLRLVLMQNQTWAKLIEMQYTNTPITKYIEDTNNVFFYLYIDGGTTYNNYMLRPQLEKSSTVHDWEPYTGEQPSPNPDYPQEIEVMQGRQVVTVKGTDYTVDLKSKNLLRQDQYLATRTVNGITFTNNGDGTFNITGTATANTSINFLNGTSQIGLRSGKTYYLYSSQPYNVITFNLSIPFFQDGVLKYLTANNSITTSGEISDIKLAFYISSGNTVNVQNVKLMLVEGSTATDTAYEPYYDYKLAGIGDVKDNFYTDKGKWYFKQSAGNVVLNGGNDEEYVYQNNARFWLRRSYWNNETVPINPTNSIMGLYCNRFIERDRGDTWAGVEGISYDNPNTTLEPIGSSFDIACNSVATTAEAFKTWLSTHNLDIWYLLQNPQITEIPSTYTTLINQLNALYQAM